MMDSYKVRSSQLPKFRDENTERARRSAWKSFWRAFRRLRALNFLSNSTSRKNTRAARLVYRLPPISGVKFTLGPVQSFSATVKYYPGSLPFHFIRQ